ncbi:MAG TPA: hypothetical protein PK400_11140, partial [Phycisphaerales bacterium]|nr:hypothetical protein [Phycisphaerales bacterium]
PTIVRQKHTHTHTHTHTHDCSVWRTSWVWRTGRGALCCVWSLALMAAWVMTASTPVSADPPRYRIINLGTLKCLDDPNDPESECESWSEAYGINNRGEVVGASLVRATPTRERGFVWLPVPNYGLNGFTMHRLPEPEGTFSHMYAFDINIDGFVVGSINTGSMEHQGVVSAVLPPILTGSGNPAYVWDLATSDHDAIDPYEGASAVAYAVSDDSPPVIVGETEFIHDPEAQFPGTWRGFRMEYTGQTAITEGMLLHPTGFPAAWGSFAFGVGFDDGPVAGYSASLEQCVPTEGWCEGTTDCNRGNHWEPAGILEAVIDENDVYSYTVGRSVNSAGNVIGSSFHDFEAFCQEHGAFWPSVSESPVPLPPDDLWTRAWAIAAPFGGGELQAVGANMDQDRAMLWQSFDDGENWTPIDLNDVSKGGDVIHCGDEEWIRLFRAYDINDHGWIVGYGILEENGPRRAFLMIPEPATYCPADLNGDFVVDVLDLLILLGAWGSYSGTPCFGSPDLNDSGVVDVQDLLILLVAWGPCPSIDVTVLTLTKELTDAGLTQQQWDDYQAIMTGGASQSVKDNWTCWMENYLSQCTTCPECPDDDPFAE